jgi:methionyl-tRNA synthetase
MKNNIFIGGAFPYANGSLHLGHVSSLLPADIIARYYRLKGKNVLYVAGSDCNGTPISIRAKQEGISPKEITDKYHTEFENCFKSLGFSYDEYARTDSESHKKIVQEAFLKLYEKGLIYSKLVDQLYCEHCIQFLSDRYVEGTCPNCKNPSRGDQCDYCSQILDPLDLINKKCKTCNNTPITKLSEHHYFALSKFQDILYEYVEKAEGWRNNAIHLSKRYLNEGLPDRSATRNLSWGIDVPIDGCEDKKIYVWIEAVLGYISTSKEWSNKNKGKWKDFWNNDVTSYYVHGKDNIPFHTLILPALLYGLGDYHLPDKIISNEYLTLEGKKISTSKNWAIWVPYILKHYDPDSIRYFLTINAPEKKDTNFSWREFIYSHNSELLGDFGNFVNRNLTFINKFYNGQVPNGVINIAIKDQLDSLFTNVSQNIEKGDVRDGLEKIFTFIRSSNKYFDEQKPWTLIKENSIKCDEVIYTCVQIIANLSILLYPYLPFSCEKIHSFLNIKHNKWSFFEVPFNTNIQNLCVLFNRIDLTKIDDEIKNIGNNSYL